MNRSSSLRFTLCPMPRISVAMSFVSCLLARRRGGDALVGDVGGRHRLVGAEAGLVGGAVGADGRLVVAVAGLLRGRPLDRLHDVHVARAAADVAADGPPD